MQLCSPTGADPIQSNPFQYQLTHPLPLAFAVCQPADSGRLADVSLCDAHGASVCGFMLGWSRWRINGGAGK